MDDDKYSAERLNDLDKQDLAFPHSRIVTAIREQTGEDQYVRKEVYRAINVLLGDIVDQLAEEMTETDEHYIKLSDFMEASETIRNHSRLTRKEKELEQTLRSLGDELHRKADSFGE